MEKGRRIAFDYGDVRIGVAVCDVDAILATPLVTLKASDKKLDTQLSEIFAEYSPIRIYVGRPAHMDGRESISSTKALAFAQYLEKLTKCPIELIDERLSTVSAARNMRDSGVNAQNSRERIDQAAAVSILDFALALERNRK